MLNDQINHLSQYQPSWKTDFNIERDKLLAVFGTAALEIEHIGSTSVKGLASKPIIDIAIIIESHKDADNFTRLLVEIGYQIFPSMYSGIPERYFWIKGDPIKYHLSIAFTDVGGFWPRQILFRDYLRSNSDARAEYAKLKEELIRKHPSSLTGDGAYSQGKTEFVYRILRLAKWKVFQKHKWQGSPKYPLVVEVIPCEDCTLDITFDNGDEGVLDMKPHLGGAAFHGIATYEDLKTAYVSKGTIVWDSGVALETEYVYARCKETKRA